MAGTRRIDLLCTAAHALQCTCATRRAGRNILHSPTRFQYHVNSLSGPSPDRRRSSRFFNAGHTMMREDEYEKIVNSLWEGVCAVDAEGRVTVFNPAAERLTGISASEARGADLQDMLAVEQCQCGQLLQEALTTGEELREVSTQMTDGQGRCIPVKVNVSLLEDESGRTSGAVATLRDVSAVEMLRRELRGEHTAHGIVSKNPRIKKLIDVLPQIAESESPVFIMGPTGTGKELFARAIHNLSPRSDAPFVAVNCGALPEDLFESELFGYRKGAFTGADKDKPGRFARAEGGTLFLDEIGELSSHTQVKLLRVLEEGQYEPLGGTEPVQADVRILSASNRDMSREVEQNTFRSDLYYRLNVVELDLPPLTERREDIPLLVDHFIEKFNAEKGRNIRGISQDALARLMRHSFPGNVRELENIVEHAYIMCRGDRIQEECLPPSVLTGWAEPCPRGNEAEESEKRRGGGEDADERSRILAALERHDGHRRRTAADLGIHESTLWRKMKKYNIDYPKRPAPEEERSEIITALEKHDGHRGRAADELDIDTSTLWRKMQKHEIDFPKH